MSQPYVDTCERVLPRAARLCRASVSRESVAMGGPGAAQLAWYVRSMLAPDAPMDTTTQRRPRGGHGACGRYQPLSGDRTSARREATRDASGVWSHVAGVVSGLSIYRY